MIVLDIEKAFDMVWHDGLIYKLNTCRFPLYIMKIINTYIKNRTFEVQIGSEISIYLNVTVLKGIESVVYPRFS